MNCQDFHDRLLDLVSGRLEGTEVQAMLEHGAACSDCETVLALEEALQTERDVGDPEQIPAAWVASMWPRIEGRISGAARNRPRPMRIAARHAVAAAVAVALLGVAFFAGQYTAGLDPGVPPGPRSTADPVASRPGDTTREELLLTLERLPGATTLLSAADASALVDRSARLRRWIQETPLAIDIGDGVQATELRVALMALPEDSAISLPASLRLRELKTWLERRV